MKTIQNKYLEGNFFSEISSTVNCYSNQYKLNREVPNLTDHWKFNFMGNSTKKKLFIALILILAPSTGATKNIVKWHFNWKKHELK